MAIALELDVLTHVQFKNNCHLPKPGASVVDMSNKSVSAKALNSLLPFDLCHLRTKPYAVSLVLTAPLLHFTGSLRLYKSSDELDEVRVSPPEAQSSSVFRALHMDRLLKRTNSWSSAHGRSESMGRWWWWVGMGLRWLVSLTLLASWPLESKEGHGHVALGWGYPFILSLRIRTSYLCMYVNYIIATCNAFLVRHMSICCRNSLLFRILARCSCSSPHSLQQC